MIGTPSPTNGTGTGVVRVLLVLGRSDLYTKIRLRYISGTQVDMPGRQNGIEGMYRRAGQPSLSNGYRIREDLL
jgi:hypothetical protein